MNRMRISVVIVASAALGCSVIPAHGLPIFSIGEGGDRTWQQAVADGNVQPHNGELTGAAREFYGTQSTPFVLGETQIGPLDAQISDGNEEHQSLVMRWGDDSLDQNTLQIGAWDYVYDVDPDLGGHKLHFSIFAPPGIWDVSVELIDANGNSAGWFLPMPPNVWTEYWLNLDILGNQGPFLYHQSGMFDITQVIAIRFDEAGMSSQPIPNNPGGNELFWNAWNHVRVEQMLPEPTTATLALLGVGGLLMRRRQRAI